MRDVRTVAKESNGNWKGGRTVHKAGYVMVRVPDHPRAKQSPYVFEHILVAEAIHGAPPTVLLLAKALLEVAGVEPDKWQYVSPQVGTHPG